MQKNLGPRPISRELTIENTTYCGADCVMCPREDYEDKWKHMEFSLFTDIVDQAVDLGIESVDACGFGDPFMDPGFRKKLEYVKTLNLKVYTSTTGHLLYEKNLPWICELIDTLKISNYACDAETYAKVHAGVVKYDRVIENLNALLSRPPSSRPHVILQFLVLPDNEHQVEEWKERWNGRADEVLVWLPHNFGGGFYSTQIEDIKDQSVTQSCGRPERGNLFVRESGEVSMCCFDFNKKLLIGDLRSESLTDILAGQPLAHLREVHETKSFEGCGLICEDCDQIHNRDHALLYSSNDSRRAGILTSHPDFMVDVLDRDGQDTSLIKIDNPT